MSEELEVTDFVQNTMDDLHAYNLTVLAFHPEESFMIAIDEAEKNKVYYLYALSSAPDVTFCFHLIDECHLKFETWAYKELTRLRYDIHTSAGQTGYYEYLVYQPLSKGDLMEMVYGKGYTGVDSAIPRQLWDNINTRIHVVDYTEGFGKLVNLYKRAAEMKLDIDYSQEYKKCVQDEEYFYNNYARREGDPWYSEEVYKKFRRSISNSGRITIEKYFPKRISHGTNKG